MNTGTQAAREAGNMVDLDSNPTKLIEIVGLFSCRVLRQSRRIVPSLPKTRKIKSRRSGSQAAIHGSITIARLRRFRRGRSRLWSAAAIAIRISITNVWMRISATISSHAFTATTLSNGGTL
jgi:hypothetical protein